MVDIYVIMELNHKTRQWVAIECMAVLATATARLRELRTTNGDSADYKLEFVIEYPE